LLCKYLVFFVSRYHAHEYFFLYIFLFISFHFIFIHRNSEILAAKTADEKKKPPVEEKSNITIHKLMSSQAHNKPIVTENIVVKAKCHPRIKYSKHVNPATSFYQQQHHQQASIIATLQAQVSQQQHQPPTVDPTLLPTVKIEEVVKKPLIIQQIEYDASASNTSQSADFPVGIIDDIDYSGIDDIELPDDVHVSFSDSMSRSDRSNDGTTTIIHTEDDKYAVLVNSSVHNRSSNAGSSQEEEDLGGSEAGDDDGSRPHSCIHCGKRYRWKSTLRRHESVECGGKEAAHQCPYCTYKAKQRGNLGVHIRKHHPEMPQMLTRRSKNKTL
jgi:hypothetical protein